MTKVIVIAIIALLIGFGAGFVLKNNTVPDTDTQVTVTNFEECVAAGNPVMESYPRQCRHEGVTYVEEVDNPPAPSPDDSPTGSVTCTPDQRDVMCTAQYEPVCGLTQVECITTPCNPVPETYGNACTACSNSRVISYTEGECSQ